MGCASSSGAPVLEAKPGSAPFMAKVHPMHRTMDGRPEKSCHMEALMAPNTPNLEDEQMPDMMKNGYHEMKHVSLDNDTIESMMLHIIEDTDREAVITEIIIPLCPPENNNNNDFEEQDHGLKSYDAKFYEGFKATSDDQEQKTIIMEVIMEAQEEIKLEEEMHLQAENAKRCAEEQISAADNETNETSTVEETVEQEETAKEGKNSDGVDESNEEMKLAAGKQENMEQPAKVEVAARKGRAENATALEANQNDEDGSSELHFDLSAEDVEMLEAQLRELSVLSPVPAVAAQTSTPALDGQPEGQT